MSVVFIMFVSVNMWARAVWLEGPGVEEEGVVPGCWIDEERKLVLWPPANEKKAHKLSWQPQDEWFKFKLIKIKIMSGK